LRRTKCGANGEKSFPPRRGGNDFSLASNWR
jgi:hypothetical protein